MWKRKNCSLSPYLSPTLVQHTNFTSSWRIWNHVLNFPAGFGLSVFLSWFVLGHIGVHMADVWANFGHFVNVPWIYAWWVTYKTCNYQSETHAVFNCNSSWVWIHGGRLKTTSWPRMWAFDPPPGHDPGSPVHNPSLTRKSFLITWASGCPAYSLLTTNMSSLHVLWNTTFHPSFISITHMSWKFTLTPCEHSFIISRGKVSGPQPLLHHSFSLVAGCVVLRLPP